MFGPRRESGPAADGACRLQGFEYFRMIDPLLRGLRPVGTARDAAGDRRLFLDRYATPMVLYFSNHVVATLRGVRRFTTLEKVRRLCGVRPTAPGPLGEAAGVFDPVALEPIVADPAARAARTPAALPSAAEAALAGPIAIDGTLPTALPRMARTLWQDAARRAAEAHAAFAVFSHTPAAVTVTDGIGSERDRLRELVRPGGFYVADRGYADCSLFQELDSRGVWFSVRLQENAAYQAAERRPRTAAAPAAGAFRDATPTRLGMAEHDRLPTRPLRLVKVWGTGPARCGCLRPTPWTSRPVRWRPPTATAGGLFFRWLECVPGCKHLVSHSRAGVTPQAHCATVAALLIGLRVGVVPDRRTLKMLCHYLSGRATLEELERHLDRLRAKADQKAAADARPP